ncbi:MAG: pentapeptide repeat-containing protein [Verrucomicrobia bacterium]|nr:pentapeptide repeat-containing protein [Verrucomicrobiota bacterium]
MAVFKRRTRPEAWNRHRARTKHAWLVPLYALEWSWSWLAYWLSGWAFLEVLEYAGTLSVVIAVISYFAESGDRLKQKHYQAWQVINSAQGKGGSGGRIEALEELVADKVPLVGVDVSEAFLQGIDLDRADLLRADLHSADIRNGSLAGAKLEFANLVSTNLRGANLRHANLHGADLQDADLYGADLGGADLEGTNLARTDLRNADFSDVRWQKVTGVKKANVFGLRNAPPGFLEWAKANGAVSIESDADWLAMLKAEEPKG